jgi:hypothetical protein
MGQNNDSQKQRSEAIRSFRERKAQEFMQGSQRLAALAQFMKQQGAGDLAVNHVAKCSLLLAEVFVVKTDIESREKRRKFHPEGPEAA